MVSGAGVACQMCLWQWCLPSVSLCACVGVCVSGNVIDDAGGTAVAEALKVNTSVQEIDLGGEWCW